MKASTALLYYDLSLGRHRIALFPVDPYALLTDLAAIAGCEDVEQYVALRDSDRSHIYFMHEQTYATHAEIADVTTDIPFGVDVFCTACRSEDCLPLFSGYGDYGEPVVFCESCHGITLMARASRALGREDRFTRAVGYNAILSDVED